MRSVNPEDLEQLATLLDGADPTSLKNATDSVFRRAATLNVTSKLATLHPMMTWATETAPDLRRRAARTRLSNGDLSGGLLWAGFTPDDLKAYRGNTLDPETVLIADSVANSDDPNASLFHRKPNENLETYLDRLRATALTSIPGLQPFEPAVEYLLGAYGDWKSVAESGGHVVAQGTALAKVLVNNSFANGLGKSFTTWLGLRIQSSGNPVVKAVGKAIEDFAPRVRSLSAPGTWLPTKVLGPLTRLPQVGDRVADLANTRYDQLRALPFFTDSFRGVSVNKAVNFFIGSDKLASQYSRATHAGQAVTRAANARLLSVLTNAYGETRLVAAAPRVTSLVRGISIAARTSGVLRGLGIGTSAAATVFSGANVISDGLNPVTAFKRQGAGYVADVAEFGFNASLTAALVSPSPFSLGAVVVFGSVYGGAKIVEHWDDITKGTGKAVDWTADTAQKAGHEVASGAKKAGHEVASGAKKVGKALNPMKW
ncbi:PE-PGRS family protein [Streptomyces sp. NPDC021020]|uniref:PE-PGRS family protein n=1 Tax=Streptomyces sp. NPDC021020 TaxID=3365109 RepID=UPI0037B28335